MQDQDKILNFLKVVGPTLPSKVAKNISTEILLASAHLSDLASQGKVKISKLKVGGSPLYYIPGDEDKLYHFAPGNVNPKDLQVLEILKDKKVLRESELELLPKVALRNLKDFAVPLHVTADGKRELFWKYYLTSNEEGNEIIRNMLTDNFEQPVAQLSTPIEPLPITQTIEVPEQEQEIQSKEEVVPEPVFELKEEPKVVVQPEEPKPEVKLEPEPIPEPVVVKESPAEEVMEESPLEQSLQEELEEESSLEEFKEEKQVKLQQVVEKKPLFQKIKDKITRKRKVIEDELSPLLENYFSKLRITIEQKEIVRKNSEIDFLLKVPSAVGKITYYCKAKSKNKCDEKDISAAYMEAQTKKLPLLFLYTNEITKKAEDMLDSGVFENVIVKKVGNEI
jgi:hypothetical protein